LEAIEKENKEELINEENGAEKTEKNRFEEEKKQEALF